MLGKKYSGDARGTSAHRERKAEAVAVEREGCLTFWPISSPSHPLLPTTRGSVIRQLRGGSRGEGGPRGQDPPPPPPPFGGPPNFIKSKKNAEHKTPHFSI